MQEHLKYPTYIIEPPNSIGIPVKKISQNILWIPKTMDGALEDDEVHVWCTTLEQSPSTNQFLKQTLSADEIQRAGQFHFSEDRDRFINSHGILRVILGIYLNISPQKIRFQNNSFGKPLVDLGSPKSNLLFNMSHSRDLAVYAIARNRQIGIDVECIRPILDIDQIIHRFFSDREVHALHTVSPELKLETFLRYWTRKEAYSKARGVGLSIPLDQLDVFNSIISSSELPSMHGDFREIIQLQTLDLTLPTPNYIAALALEKQSTYRLSCIFWQ